MKIVFLHIPKTAGQSIHHGLERAFGSENVAPVRVNEHWPLYSLEDLKKYQVLSGHLDWAMTDFFPNPKIVFTVLREPLERISSLYLYLWDKAANMDATELEKPQNMGLRYVKEHSINDYFSPSDKNFGEFIKNSYDNFYTYYFAGRNYKSRNRFREITNQPNGLDNTIIDMAISNIRTLNYVCKQTNISQLGVCLSKDTGLDIDFSSLYVNVNKNAGERSRFEMLRDFDISEETETLLRGWCRLDSQFMQKLVDRDLIF